MPDHKELVKRLCGHETEMVSSSGETVSVLAVRRKRLAAAKCAACGGTDSSSKVERWLEPSRLPDGARLVAVYNGARGEWCGELTAPVSGQLMAALVREMACRIDEAAQPRLEHSTNDLLSLLPAPLRLLRGPIPVIVETWSDGAIVARLPCAALEGHGRTAGYAIDDLAAAIFEFATATSRLLERGESLGGPLKCDWDNLTALVDVSALVFGYEGE